MVLKPSRFKLEDYVEGDRKTIVNKRMSQSETASRTISLHMSNIRLILDVMRTKFPALIEEEENEEI